MTNRKKAFIILAIFVAHYAVCMALGFFVLGGMMSTFNGRGDTAFGVKIGFQILRILAFPGSLFVGLSGAVSSFGSFLSVLVSHLIFIFNSLVWAIFIFYVCRGGYRWHQES